jgi:hypothetical protein
MKPVPNHSIMARRYFDCAQKQILLAENTAVDATRTHITPRLHDSICCSRRTN